MLEKFAGKKVLITGGLGFIGSSIAMRLAPVCSEVALLDVDLPGHGANPHNIDGIVGNVTVHDCDIRDAAGVGRLVQDRDFVFSIAGQSSHTDSMSDPFPDIDINCRGNMVLLEAIRHRNPSARIVYASTRAVYGAPAKVPVTEDSPTCPVDIYGADKLAGEYYHLIYHRVHGIRATVLRCSNGYGPRAQIKHSKFGILNWFVGLILTGATIRVFGDGSQLRDYTYIDDIVDAFLLAAASDTANGRIYNVASRQQTRFIDMVRMLIDIAGEGAYELIPWPGEYKKIEVGDFAADTSLISTELGWHQKTTLRDGLALTFEYFRKNRQYYI